MFVATATAGASLPPPPRRAPGFGDVDGTEARHAAATPLCPSSSGRQPFCRPAFCARGVSALHRSPGRRVPAPETPIQTHWYRRINKALVQAQGGTAGRSPFVTERGGALGATAEYPGCQLDPASPAWKDRSKHERAMTDEDLARRRNVDGPFAELCRTRSQPADAWPAP
jgi:hypothetical protein